MAQFGRVLEGQAALVTGGGSGIGFAVAEGLAATGAAVAINYFGSPDDANGLAAKIVQAGGKALPVRGDVSVEADVIDMFGRAVAAFGTLDIVVANAGIQIDANVADMTLDKWNGVLAVNLTGQFLCAREAIKEFRRRGPHPQISRALGKIICMSSVHEVIPWAGHVNYATSKGGVELMMKTLAQEVAREHIRVNSIAPGAIRTHINHTAWETSEALGKLMRLMPYGRIGEPEDIANAAVFLASDLADYITGATLFVDGGMTLYPGFEDNG